MLDFVEQYGQFDIQSREAVEGQNHFGEQEVVVRKSFVNHSILPCRNLIPTSVS